MQTVQEDAVRIYLFASYSARPDRRGGDSRSTDYTQRPVVGAKSEADVRYDGSKSFGNTSQIDYEGVANILHQTVEFLCDLGITEEVCEILSVCY